MFGKAGALTLCLSGLVGACGPKAGAPQTAALAAPAAGAIPAPAAAQPLNPPPPPGIGPVHAGMSVVKLEALGLPYRLNIKSFEGADYVVYLIDIGDGVEVSATIVNGLSADVSTRSVGYLTAEGAHVGDTIARLRKLYPAGEVVQGYESEVGLYYTFKAGRTDGGEYFRFDADALGEDCVVRNLGCPADMAAIKSIRLDVY